MQLIGASLALSARYVSGDTPPGDTPAQVQGAMGQRGLPAPARFPQKAESPRTKLQRGQLNGDSLSLGARIASGGSPLKTG